MHMKEIAQQAKEQLAELTGLEPVTVLDTFKNDGGWHVSVEMVELPRRIPQSLELVGTYEVHLDEKGEMLSFKRVALRRREATEPTRVA